MLRELRDGPVVWLTLDRPERLNAFRVVDYRDLRVAVERSAADAGVRVIVVTGNGRAFSAGADRSLVDGTAFAEERAAASEEFIRFLGTLADCDKPLIAAVNGLAVGIGVTMLLYFDFVMAVESARFRLSFTALGLAPEAGSSVLLAARARWADAMWAMLSSEWIEAETARDMGLAWRLVPDDSLREEASKVAATLADLNPESVMATKRLMNAGRAEAARLAIDREMVEMGRLAQP
jgi:enoyl-CoA hydratase/carnithine racemase